MAAIRGLARSENFESSIVDSFYDWYYVNTHGIFANDNAQQIAQRFSNYSQLHGGKFAEILIDEAQDFEHRIIQSLNALAGKVSCGADRDQDIRNIYGNNAEEQISAILRVSRIFRNSYWAQILEIPEKYLHLQDRLFLKIPNPKE